jgi:uncharacterized membrane protein YvbJ
MSLIKCVDCGTEVSDKAERCPKCACPIAINQTVEKTQVIEQTSKRLKLQLLIGIGVLFLGFISLFSGSSGGAMVFLILGFIIIIASRISIWWNHE